MTAKTEMIRARITPDLKHTVEEVLDKLGLTHTELIRIVYSQIAMLKALPFEVKIPNKETRKVINDLENGRNLKHFKNVEDLFEDLGI